MKCHSPGISPVGEVREAFERALGARRRVLIIGGYGVGNLGDEAILSVLLGELRAMNADVRVISADADSTARLHDAAAVRATPAALARSLWWSDTVLIGGGGIFSRYMGSRSMLLPLVALAARVAGRRVIFRALGVYRSTPRLVARALVTAMSLAAFVSVRDDASVHALRAFGLRRQPLRESDPALRLKPTGCEAVVPARSVGIAVRRVRDEDAQGRLTAAVVEAIDDLIGEGFRPVFLAFSTHPSEPAEQDLHYAREIRALTRDPARSRIIEAPLTPGEMRGVVAGLDALIAVRFHAIVFGHAGRVPMAVIPYDDKCVSFASEHDIHCLNFETLSAHAIVEQILAATGARVAA